MSKVRKKSVVIDPDANSGRKGGRLAEWSRRKAAARSRSSIQTGEDTNDQQARYLKNDVPIAGDVKGSGQALKDADMPPLETLDENSDYSGFLSPGVSEKLRKQALRKLFHLDAYNLTDGLDDYAEDYTNFAALGDILTSDLRLRKQREADAMKEELPDAETSIEKGKDEQGMDPESANVLLPEARETMSPEEHNTETRNEDQA